MAYMNAWVSKQDAGNAKMQSIAKYIAEGAMSFLQAEYRMLAVFVVIAGVALGATSIERHITLDRNMWGSDHSSSIEPDGLIKLVKGIRSIEKATQYEPGPRKQFEGENAKKES